MHSPSTLVGQIDALIRSRKTTRAFLPDEVSQSQVHELFDIARTAPSTFNTQPWRAHVLMGSAKSRLSEALVQAHSSGTYPLYAAIPNPAPKACSDRQDDFGRRYYKVLGIDRTDVAARSRQTARNYVFFDAPVGIVFTIDKALTEHSWLDYGLFLQNLMLAAQARGLATCPQVSFVRYQSVIATQLSLAATERVVCGMSLGYPEQDAGLNRMQMPREPVATWLQWH